MNIKRVAIASVIVEGRSELEVKIVREIKLRSYLPREQERSPSAGLAGSFRYLRSSWAWRRADSPDLYRHKRIVRSSQRRRFSRWFRWRRGGNIFAILAVGYWRYFSATDRECMFPLLSQSLRIDVWVPHHARIKERVRHSACSERKIVKALVTPIRLADVDRVAVFFEWSAATRRATRCVVAKRDIC